MTSFPEVDPNGDAAAGAAVMAAARGDHRTLNTLLHGGQGANTVDAHGTAILLAAARAADVEPAAARQCTAMLLASGADANTCGSRKLWKPLMAAAKSGDLGVIGVLLGAGAQVEARYPNGKTALYCAAEWGQLEAVRALAGRG